ncbi:uncharacterized protein LOC118647204 [Monomorium pharaonis]|uniref:uncharacterized protein LOC118647204 n=1 Tax=Monomorium pharaonis TaxID=307658 RepID=UPI0017474F35|nr:uncharacterized protein LOC118647204 [Monomorium pharaonis]
MVDEYAEYRCAACKKEIKSQVVTCKSCVKLFFHPGCASKHKVYDRNREYVSCPGPYEKFTVDSEKDIDMKKTPIQTGSGRERLSSTGSTGSGGSRAIGVNVGMDTKIDWLVRTMREMKDEMACKREIKMLIKETVQEEIKAIKQEMEDLRKIIRGGMQASAENVRGSYSEAIKKKKENIIIIKPKTQQESETTKKIIKEKVDIKNMPMGITKVRKGREGTVILGCETGEEIDKLKDVVQSKLGDNYNVTESVQKKPKIKIVNISEEEIELDDDELIDTIKKQNSIGESRISIVKKIPKRKNMDDSQSRRKGKEGRSLIIEVDEVTHELMLKKEKLNIGWRKCPVFNHFSIKRCFKCWGFYHIAKNCTRDETCHKCTGKHKASECREKQNKCVNCMFKIKTYNLKIKDDHDALDPECPTYKRAIEEEKRRGGWEAKK